MSTKGSGSYTSPKVTYNYQEQLAIGKAAEALLDAYFSRWYAIEVIPHEIEMQIHSDRLFIDPYDRQVIVEYKADYIGHKSGNIFIETMHFDRLRGWVYQTQADVLVYWVVKAGLVLAWRPGDVRARVEQWKMEYPVVGTANETSMGSGVLVPIHVLKELAIFEGTLYEPQAHNRS